MPSRFRKVLSLWLPVVLWAAVIFALSSIPSLNSGLGVWDLILRKLAHAGEYALLAALLFRAITRFWPAFLVAVAYAVSDEFHQHFVRGRAGTPRDVAVDAGGALLGLVAFAYLRRSITKITSVETD
jgi:VanZ family protein